MIRRRREGPALPARLPTGSVLLEARGVTIELGGRAIVRGADLAIRAGEVVALVGPNGAGKSTLLAALAGDAELSAGQVLLGDTPLGRWTPREAAMRRAVLPQQVTVSFPFRCDEVVRMGRAPWAATSREDDDDAAVRGALLATDAQHLAPRQYTTLSGGERARVSLARVLAQTTQVLVLDEPTAALDVHHQELVMEVVRARADAGDGVVVVLHDLALAAAHADRVAVLDAGVVVAEGITQDVLTGELLSAVYRHEIEVLPHPTNGLPLVVPARRA